jgi:hypothetical protein
VDCSLSWPVRVYSVQPCIAQIANNKCLCRHGPVLIYRWVGESPLPDANFMSPVAHQQDEVAGVFIAPMIYEYRCKTGECLWLCVYVI